MTAPSHPRVSAFGFTPNVADAVFGQGLVNFSGLAYEIVVTPASQPKQLKLRVNLGSVLQDVGSSCGKRFAVWHIPGSTHHTNRAEAIQVLKPNVESLCPTHRNACNRSISGLR